MKKLILFIFFLTVAISAGIYIKKKFFISNKERIKKTLKLAEKYLEEKDHIRFMKQFSIEYRDDFGNTWGTLFFFVKSIMKNYQKIRVSLSKVNIKIEGEEATVRFIGKGEAVSDYGEVIREMGRFLIKMEKEGTKWKITYLEEEKYTFD